MPLPYETLPGDIDHLIADDHAVVERQFQHLEAGRGDARVLVDQIGFELALHAFAEAGMENDSTEGRDEHAEMKEPLVSRAGRGPADGRPHRCVPRGEAPGAHACAFPTPPTPGRPRR